MKTFREFVTEAMHRVHVEGSKDGKTTYYHHDLDATDADHAKKLVTKMIKKSGSKDRIRHAESHEKINQMAANAKARDELIAKRQAERSEEEKEYLRNAQKSYDSSGPYKGE